MEASDVGIRYQLDIQWVILDNPTIEVLPTGVRQATVNVVPQGYLSLGLAMSSNDVIGLTESETKEVLDLCESFLDRRVQLELEESDYAN